MTPFLEVKNMKKAYGAIKAVDGVTLSVGPGEIVGVIGPNGSGKTTLFNSILGQIKPSAGASNSAARTSPACRRWNCHGVAWAAPSRRCRCSGNSRCGTISSRCAGIQGSLPDGFSRPGCRAGGDRPTG